MTLVEYQTNLSSDGELVEVFVSHRSLLFVRVVKDNRHTRFRDTSLAILVNELLQTCSSHLETKLSNLSSQNFAADMVSWPSGLRRQFKALVLRGAGSNPAEAYFS